MNRRKTTKTLLTLFLSGVAATTFASLSMAAGQKTSKVPVLSITNGFALVDGASSRLTRTDSGISMQLRTRELNAGHAYTLWVAVFNYPENCAAAYQCNDGDIGSPAVVADVMRAAGNVVGNAGRANFAGHKALGENRGSIFPPLLPPGVQPPGLLNPMGAEIHLLVHSHGPMIAEYMPDMIRTFGGGCVDPGPPFVGLWFPQWGAQGPNTCVTEQVAIHPSPLAP